MSILKRFARTYLSITLVSIILFSLIIISYSQKYSKAEGTRMGEITLSVKHEIKQALITIVREGENVKKWVEVIGGLNELDAKNDILNLINIEAMLNNSQADYIAILGTDEVYLEVNKIGITDNKELLSSGINRLKSGKNDKKGYLYTTEEGCNFVFVDTIIINNEVKGFIGVIKKLNKEYLDIIGNLYKRKIELVEELEEDLEKKYNYDKEGGELLYKIIGDKVNSYIPINGEGAGKDYFLKVSEPKTTGRTVYELSKYVLIMFIVAIILANTIIYYIVKRRVVNRIIDTNNQVNNIVENGMSATSLNIDDRNDEITSLSSAINNMLLRIKNDEKKLIIQNERNMRLLKAMSNGYLYIRVFKKDNGDLYDGKIIEMNDSAKKMYGISRDEKVETLTELISKVNVRMKKVISDVTLTQKVGEHILMEDINLHDDVWVTLSISCLEENHISVIINDVSNIKQKSNKLNELVNIDDITKLHSRFYFMEKLEGFKSCAKEFQLCFIDLDNFKVINDTIGHHRGDKILQIAGESLKKLEGENVIVARIGGDEFVVLRVGSQDGIEEFGQLVINSLNKRVKFNNYTYNIRGSIGIAKYPLHSNDPFKIMQYADVALYEAKYQGGNQYKIFNNTMMENFEMDTRLKQGIESGELEVYYQPVFNTKISKVVGAEALVRWNRGNEVIAPSRFIGTAKKNGDIVYIDEFVLKSACKFCKNQIDRGDERFSVSVNISHKYLTMDGFVQRLESILKSINLPPSSLKLEITEDELISDYNTILMVLKRVKRLGVKLALDDFGIGYSSFKYIKNLPLDIVKLDKSLVFDIEGDKKGEYIIDTLIKLCGYLGLGVICEGVEQKEQMELLKSLQCTDIQGYYISKPVNKEGFIEIYNKLNN
ncbi:MAG: EAL domain-containing protein [Clostridium sp.]